MSVAQGWFGRAERLLADEPESAEHGHLAIGRAMTAMISGDIPQILEQAEIALEIGKLSDDRELQAYSLSSAVARSFSRVKSPRAWRFWTRRPLRPLAGELKPFATGMIYCMTISSAQGLSDYRRAGEWTAVANRWCDRQDISGFPGVCRVHRAEAMRLQGDWNEAEQQAIAACEVGDYGYFVASMRHMRSARSGAAGATSPPPRSEARRSAVTHGRRASALRKEGRRRDTALKQSLAMRRRRDPRAGFRPGGDRDRGR